MRPATRSIEARWPWLSAGPGPPAAPDGPVAFAGGVRAVERDPGRQPDPHRGSALRSLAGLGVAGPALLLATLATTGGLDRSSAMAMTVSAVTVEGPYAPVLVWAQVAFALGLVALAVVVHRHLPGRSPAGPAALALSGLTGLLMLSFTCGVDCIDDGVSAAEGMHIGAAVAGGTLLGLAPLLLARRVGEAPAWLGFRRFSVVASLLTGVAMLGWAAAMGAPWEGVVERVAIAVPTTWATVTAVRVRAAMLREPRFALPRGLAVPPTRRD